MQAATQICVVNISSSPLKRWAENVCAICFLLRLFVVYLFVSSSFTSPPPFFLEDVHPHNVRFGWRLRNAKQRRSAIYGHSFVHTENFYCDKSYNIRVCPFGFIC
ncbi:hypothetical protein CEXT_265921 [Caerostris extrusa]|uniref:Secreted protein n=1 Tax=Caerostris extrusa TaxID=172846 RepID=A0AAV4WH32_CAEEX|nr:hypothetical protein CEXT_265921 [Caerostris extrusa]